MERVDARIRLLLGAASFAFAILFTVASALQLRPFFWDTIRVEESMARFSAHFRLFQAGAWARIFLLFPMLFVAVGLRSLLPDRLLVRAGTGFLLMSGILWAASGVANTAIGVAVESYLPKDPSAHAVQVLADSLFWIHDNLATLGIVVLGAGALCLSPALRYRGFPPWLGIVGAGALGGGLAVIFLFTLRNWRFGSPLYLGPWVLAVLSVLGWALGIGAAVLRSMEQEKRQSAAGQSTIASGNL
jgi:hypothetical protein